MWVGVISIGVIHVLRPIIRLLLQDVKSFGHGFIVIVVHRMINFICPGVFVIDIILIQLFCEVVSRSLLDVKKHISLTIINYILSLKL